MEASTRPKKKARRDNQHSRPGAGGKGKGVGKDPPSALSAKSPPPGKKKLKALSRQHNAGGVGASSGGGRPGTSQSRAAAAAARELLEDVPVAELSSQQKADLIAELCESVMEDPDSAFTSVKVMESSGGGGDEEEEEQHSIRLPSKVRRLIDLADPRLNGEDEMTARLALISLLAVFRDVLPSYRIRLPTQAERSVRVTKETKKLWDYERNLLEHYQSYLKLLERTWTTSAKRQEIGRGVSILSATAIMCLCELLKSAPHFNFRSNIMGVVVKQMNNRQNDEVSAACCSAIETIFTTDGQGEVALEAARLVSKMIKDRNFAVRPEVLRVFVSLPLRVHEDEAQAAKLAAEANKKKKKKDRATAEIEEEMREGDATVNKITLARAQADTLHAVTLTYFRILKSEDLSDGKVAELLPAALEGLAKFAHLINMDTVVDLLAVLKNMLKRVDNLPLDAGLNCVLTAFQTLHGPGQEMQIDQKEYVDPLYSLIPRLCSESESAKNTELAIKCLHAAFIRRKEYSTVRAAAFVKQLSSVSMHAPPHTSGPLLAFVRQFIQRYPAVHQLLENEQDIITSGAYTPMASDPEHTNPFATSAWELATLQFHVHPSVAYHASGAAAQRMLQLPAEDAGRIRADLIGNSREGYIAYKISKKKHPLRAKGAHDKRRRQQYRFITPRDTDNHHLK